MIFITDKEIKKIRQQLKDPNDATQLGRAIKFVHETRRDYAKIESILKGHYGGLVFDETHHLIDGHAIQDSNIL